MASVWLAVLNRFVEKYLNVKGGPTVVDFNPAVQLQIPVLIGVEERYHQGWTRFGIRIAVTGGAAQQGAFQFHNPLTSNAIAVIERWSWSNVAVAAGSVTVGFQAGPASIADLTTPQTPVNLDGRSTVGSSMAVSTTTNGVQFARGLFAGTQVNGIEIQWIETVNQEITLIPGSAILTVDGTAANNSLYGCIWRERPLESSELT